MAGTTKITSTAQMEAVATRVEEGISRYNQSISKLYQIGGELDAMWDGEANDKFRIKFESDRERFNALTKMLTTYVEVLRQTVATYVNAESEAVNVVVTNSIR